MRIPFNTNDFIAWKYRCGAANPKHGWWRVQLEIHAPAFIRSLLPESDPCIREAARVEAARQDLSGNQSRDRGSTLRRQTLRSADAVILEAIELGMANSGRADWIRASILAGQTSGQIAEAVGLREEVVLTFERLFFDVRDRLDDGLWFNAYVLHPLLLTLDQIEPASEAYAAVFDRAILYETGYRLGSAFLKMIAHPALDSVPGTQIRLVSDSPIVRFLKWCWTAEESLLFDIQLLEKVNKLFSKSGLTDDEFDRRADILVRMIERYERKRSPNKPRRPRRKESVERRDQSGETRKTSQESRCGIAEEDVPLRDIELDRDVQAA